MIKKYLSLSLSFIFLISHSIQACDFSGVIDQTRPDRSSPLIRQHRNGDIAFNEYWVSGQNVACGSRALGFNSRTEAIDHLLDALRTGPSWQQNRLRSYIKSSLISDRNLLGQVFGYTPNNLEEFAGTEEHQNRYLEYFRNNSVELKFTMNRHQDGSVIQNNRNYGLINALAMIQGVNLYIYKPLQGQFIYLSHCFTNDRDQRAGNINLIYRAAHYNTLALVNDRQGNQQALAQENIYLEQLRHQLQEQQRQQGPLRILSTSEDMQVDDVASEETNEESLSGALSLSTSLSQTVPSIQLTKEQVFQFICHDHDRTIGQLSAEDSCNQAYRYLVKHPSTDSTFALTRLALDKNFTPQGQGRQSFLEQTLEDLNTIIRRSGKNIKEHHYAKVFKGKILVQLNRMPEAYHQFKNLKETNKNFTRTYLVDMAEMIIEYGFVPHGMTSNSAITYAQGILNNLPRSGRRATTTHQTGSSDILGSLHLNAKGTRNQVDDLIQQATRTRTSDSTPRGHRLSQTGKASDTQRRKKRHKSTKSQIHPIYIPQKPTRERIRNMTDGQLPDLHENDVSKQHDKENSSASRKRKRRKRSDGGAESSEDISKISELTSEDDFDGVQETWLDSIEASDNALNECRRLILLGKTYGYQRNNQQAIAYYQKALNMLGAHGNPELMAQAHIGLGNVHDGGDGGVRHYQTALRILGDRGNPEIRAQAHIGLGNARRHSVHYQTALRILGDRGNPEIRAQAHIGLGNARDGDRIAHYRTALRILGDRGNLELRAKAHIGLGNARDGDQIAHYRTALRILGDRGNLELRAKAHIGLGNALGGQRRSEEALNSFNEALVIAKTHHLQSRIDDIEKKISNVKKHLHSRKSH